VLMRSSRAFHVSCVDKADPCSMTRPMRCSARHSKSLSVAPPARDHGATPFGVALAVRLQYTHRSVGRFVRRGTTCDFLSSR
jgi:hypothetical protein